METPGKVLIAAPVHNVLLQGLADRGYECVVREKISQQEAFGLIADCVGVITSTRLQLDKALLDAAPLLRWIGRMGSGMEVIDVPYAMARGIKCVSSPEGNSNAVGEHAMGMLLSLIRRIGWSHREMMDGQWLREENRGSELEGKTIGIIGLGHTGRSFARKLQAFDMRILAYDKYKGHDVPAYIEPCADLTAIFRDADIISFHVPLQEDTRHYFNHDFLRQMQRPFVLVNTSRGPVVDTLALADGIAQRRILGACLDVFEEEPVNKLDAQRKKILDDLAATPQLVITPHIAGYTAEALFKMSRTLYQKLFVE